MSAPRKRGRPRVTEDRRDAVLYVRMTPDEYAAIQAASERAHYRRVADYVRIVLAGVAMGATIAPGRVR